MPRGKLRTMLGLVPGVVVAHDPPWGVRVAFRNTGQQVPYRINMERDWANAISVRQKPLPQIGTWGLIAFPYDDLRNGTWICAYYPSMMDALTTSLASGFAATDPFIDMDAHFSGDLSYKDGLGNVFRQWIDGSTFVAGSGSGTPTLYRHTVDGGNNQTVQPFTYAQRVSGNPQSGTPFYFNYVHKSGTSFSVDPSGNFTVSGAPGATFTCTFGVATLTINSSGLVTLALPGSETFNITQGGASASDFLALVSKLVTAFNAHTHPVTGVQAGGATVTSQTPSSAWNASTIKSTIIDISN